jgi:hypothetical protein
MTLQIELAPEIEARLAAEAAQHGMALEAYALKLLEGALPPRACATGTGRMTVEEFHKMLDEISSGAENLPSLPTSAFTRESFYEDRL